MAAFLEITKFAIFVTIYRPVEIPNELIRYISLVILIEPSITHFKNYT